VPYFAAVFAQTENGWVGTEAELSELSAVDDIADLMREAAVETTGDPVILLVEQDDEWFAVVRLDGEDDPRAFVSDGRANLIVSIHCDALEGAPHCTGITTYYHGGNHRSQELAEAVQEKLTTATRLPDRGARPDTTRYDTGFYVLRNATCPAVLVETGYISSAPTAARLREPGFRLQVARGIMEGLQRYVQTAPVRTARR